MQPLKTQRITIKKVIITHLKECRDELVYADLTSFSGIKQNNQSPYFLASLVFFIAMPISIMGATIDAILAWVLSQDNVIRLTLKYTVRCLVSLIYLSFSILSACLLLLLSTPDLLSSAVEVVYLLGLLIAECVILPFVFPAVCIIAFLLVVLAACVCSLSFIIGTSLLPLILGSPFLVAAYYVNTKFLLVGIPIFVQAMIINTVYMSTETKAFFLFGVSLLAIVVIPVVAALVLGMALPLFFALLLLVTIFGGAGFILMLPNVFAKCSLIELQLDLSYNPAIRALKESFLFEMCVGLLASKPSHKVPPVSEVNHLFGDHHAVHQPVELKDICRSDPITIAREGIWQMVYQPIKSAILITSSSYPNNDNLDDVPTTKGGF